MAKYTMAKHAVANDWSLDENWRLQICAPRCSGTRLDGGVRSELGVADALGRKTRAGMNTEVCQLSKVEQLPTHWLGFEGVDTVLLQRPTTAADAISAQQLAALRQWVSMGGVGVECGSKRWRIAGR